MGNFTPSASHLARSSFEKGIMSYSSPIRLPFVWDDVLRLDLNQRHLLSLGPRVPPWDFALTNWATEDCVSGQHFLPPPDLVDFFLFIFYFLPMVER